MYTKKFFVLLAISMMALSACASPATPTAAPTEVATAAPTEPPVPAFPTGKFMDADNDQGGIVFNEDGTWKAYNGIYTLAKGTYSATDTTYTEETSNSDCPTMTFNYTFDGANLTFNYIGDPSEDPCDGRRAGFDNKTYILQK